MKLARLEIVGFKSFAQKTVIEFNDGITAIIGPNGSGKSNIADAIRWVLGEQSAKALRGARMEDVIFNGTEQRRPLSYCEVTLVFDNADGLLNIDYTEVSVTRRVYRSNEGEYLLNGKQCRLKDIQELFRDTGIGKEGYSIIGQGRVDEILSNRSGDRRAIFEEAAGVMRYRARKEEAERKLENTRKNLIRINDILTELEVRVGPLHEQCIAAKRYIELRDELKKAELNLFLIQYDKLNERLTETNALIEQICNEIADNEALESGLAKGYEAEEALERTINSEISGLKSNLLTYTAGIQSTLGEARVLQERRMNAQKERDSALNAMCGAQETLKGLSERKLSISDSIAGKSKLISKLRQSLEDLEEKFKRYTYDLDEKAGTIDRCKSSIIEAMNRLSDAKSLRTRLETMKVNLEASLKSINDEISQRGGELSGLDKELIEANAQLKGLREEKNRLDNDRISVEEKRNATSGDLVELKKAMRKSEQALESGLSRLKVLKEMNQAHEGYYSSVRNVLRDSKRDTRLGEAVEGALAELIHVPAEFETAIEMALGSSLQNIVTPTDEDAKLVIEHLRANNYGRATFLPVSSMKPRTLNNDEKCMIQSDGVIGIASDLVGYGPRYKNVIENLLGRTVIVRDLDTGIKINAKSKSAFRIATVKGDIINPGGSITGGSTQRREFSLLGRQREMTELENRLKSQRLELDDISKRAEAGERLLSELGQSSEMFRERIHNIEISTAKQLEKIDIIQKYISAAKFELETQYEERGRLQDSLADVESKLGESETAQGSIEDSNTATQEDITRLQNELNAMRLEQERKNSEITSLKVQLMAENKELAALNGELNRVDSDAARLSADIGDKEQAVNSLNESMAQLDLQIIQTDASVCLKRTEAESLEDRINGLEAEQDKRIDKLKELRVRRGELSSAIEALRDRRHRAELSLNKAELELSGIQERVWNDYNLTYDNITPYRRGATAAAEHLLADDIRKEMRSLGDVRVGAIEEYDLVKERYDSLKAQYGDLEMAESDLRQLITELLESMKLEFRRQFELIRSNFTSVFSELFRGGKADLVLSDGADILNCDIDIIAQPPGKKLQLLSLLSGGERALTAIALLFAILKLKPTAFCILDEIETSLDEVNVSNFAEYLGNYSSDTQFILITHRKGSMAVCNALYGVTMEEKGVSKIVSARFDEAG